MKPKRTIIVIFLITINCVINAQYTNEWAVDIEGGQSEADLVAKETGCVNQGKTDFFFVP